MQADIFIPARLDSTRLPEKHLQEINHVPIIKHLVNRLNSCNSIKNIIVCTTNSKHDDKLVQFLEKENILTFRGSKFDILERFLNAARKFNTDIIIDPHTNSYQYHYLFLAHRISPFVMFHVF